MNRVVLLGIAVFLAIVGIALLGTGADSALAGHGCCGCCGGGGGCYGDCGGGYGGGCHGCHGGGGYGCHGGGGCGGCGGYAYNGGHGGSYAAVRRAPTPTAPAPALVERSYQRQPASFRRISFRR